MNNTECIGVHLNHNFDAKFQGKTKREKTLKKIDDTNKSNL